MTEKELVRWRLWAQYLTRPTTAEQAAGHLCGLQAQYAANAVHALRLRCGSTDMTGLVKAWTLRGTLHLFPACDLPLYFYDQVGDPFDTDYGRWRFSHGCGISRERMWLFCEIIQQQLSETPISRDALKDICRREGMTAGEEPWVFDGWGGAVRLLAEGGSLCISADKNRHYMRFPAVNKLPREEGRLKLLETYVRHYGPVTVSDMTYFFRWSKRELRALMARLPLQTVDCKGVTHYWLEQPTAQPPLPRCLFLAGFDPMLLGYEKTENPILLPAYVKRIFNNTGIVFPALLVDGVVRGKWKEQAKTVDVTLFEELSDGRKQAVLNAAKKWWRDKPVRFL